MPLQSIDKAKKSLKDHIADERVLIITANMIDGWRQAFLSEKQFSRHNPEEIVLYNMAHEFDSPRRLSKRDLGKIFNQARKDMKGNASGNQLLSLKLGLFEKFDSTIRAVASQPLPVWSNAEALQARM